MKFAIYKTIGYPLLTLRVWLPVAALALGIILFA